MHMKQKQSTAFSLIELLVVIVVIGILAAVVVPNTILAGDSARVAATAQDLRSMEKAIEAYRNSSGRWPTNVNGATLPAEIAPAFKKADPFSKTVPIGGIYDYDGTSGDRGPIIKMYSSGGNNLPADATLTELDIEMDDGDLTTGRLRKSGSQLFYYLVAGD